MRIQTTCALTLGVVLSCPVPSRAAEADYERSIAAFLHEHFDHGQTGMVVAVVDPAGTRVFAVGKTDSGAADVNADTLFEIGSCTKTFTALLLQEMARRGEVALDDPVAKYLPPSVKVPSRNGKEIKLSNLATQDSGLPFNADNLTGVDWQERFATYTVPRMYEFLSTYALTQDPGASFQYSNIGMGVLGHVLSLKAGANYESLVVDRICRPLHMDDTRITLTPELKARMAQGHGEDWKPEPNFEFPAIPGAGALRSTANDLAKYVAANLGLTPSDLTPLMRDMHVIRHHSDSFEWGNTAMPWMDQDAYAAPGSQLLGHGGGTGGFSSFIGFDLPHHRGVAILSNQTRIHSSVLGWRILQHARLAGLDPVTMMAVRQVTGTGLELKLDPNGNALTVIGTRPNSPADRARVAPGTIIRSINGTPTARKTLEECVPLIRGDAGTTVRLAIADPKQPSADLPPLELRRERFLLGE